MTPSNRIAIEHDLGTPNPLATPVLPLTSSYGFYTLQYKMTRQQINARIPEELFIAAHGRPESMTELVEDGLRWRLEMPASPGIDQRAAAGKLLKEFEVGVTREEFEALDERVRKIERAAENAGAL